jgi:hypothetical protein
MAILDALASVLPVLLLFGLGALLARRGFLHAGTVEDMRRLVLYVTLPSSLFLTFLRVSIEPRYLLVVVPVFVACVVVLLAGPLIGRLVRIPSRLFPFLMTGFEAGMLGYAIYGSVYGVDQLYRFAIVDIGQVTFVFFILVTALARLAPEMRRSLGATAVAFVRTPVIIAIAAGILASALGLAVLLDSTAPGVAGLTTLRFLSAMTTPLITLVIGATTRISAGSLGRPLRTVVVRMALWVALAFLFAAFVTNGLGLDALFAAAIFTMAVLPAPFVIPLYMPEGADAEEHDFVTSVLSVGTVATLIAFPFVVLAFPA